jgi:hypothetical protein
MTAARRRSSLAAARPRTSAIRISARARDHSRSSCSVRSLTSDWLFPCSRGLDGQHADFQALAPPVAACRSHRTRRRQPAARAKGRRLLDQLSGAAPSAAGSMFRQPPKTTSHGRGSRGRSRSPRRHTSSPMPIAGARIGRRHEDPARRGTPGATPSARGRRQQPHPEHPATHPQQCPAVPLEDRGECVQIPGWSPSGKGRSVRRPLGSSVRITPSSGSGGGFRVALFVAMLHPRA